MKHILTARQFSHDMLLDLYREADRMDDASQAMSDRRRLMGSHAGRIVATLFYESSTRTRASFESGALRLGMGVISTENAAEYSSAAKGESLQDSIRTMAQYVDMIVLRHKENGAAAAAAEVSPVPIINAGDGTNEHPTQALLDTYTIWSKFGRLTELNIVIGGDLRHGRTARSLAQLMGRYDSNRFSFVSTPELAMGEDVLHHIGTLGATYRQTDDLPSTLHDADVVYWTRLQRERLTDPTLQAGFTIGEAALERLPDRAIIMHPFPRVGEIETVVDADPRAVYFDQMGKGMDMRMALMDMVLSGR